MKIIHTDNNRYDIEQIVDNGYYLTIHLVQNILSPMPCKKTIQTQGNYQYLVLDELTYAYLDCPKVLPDALITHFELSELDVLNIKDIAEPYQNSYFVLKTEHQLVLIISDNVPTVCA